ncbi:hypothetical protein OJAV_G00060350 [Oryzias javanicus]|uniref:RIB43A-like with coiled-coils protein 2 n=1 Tax=Oryzias javanicus TaxID=123683 RepID=A0A437DBI9_ORYJA|nr:hypothetical protein OJAV_G00060350 [Oryzias javanicus]
MQNIELSSERAARLILERRRDREAERRERVFNDKVRTMGVDREALDEQVREKRRQEEKVKKEQEAFDAEALRQSSAAGVLQITQMKQKHEREKALHTFRSQNQQPRTRKEFDLNDPDRWRKMDPSEAQMILPGLAGEDPTRSSRRHRQKEQLREWLAQQQAEREASRGQRELEEQKYNQSREEILNKAGERLRLQMEQRREAAIATKNYNLAMIEEKHQLKAQNDPDYVLESAAVPGFSPGADARPPPETVQQVIQFQEYQIQEKKRLEVERNREEEMRNSRMPRAAVRESGCRRIRDQTKDDSDSTRSWPRRSSSRNRISRGARSTRASSPSSTPAADDGRNTQKN